MASPSPFPPPPAPPFPPPRRRSGPAIASVIVGAANVLCLFALIVPPFVGLILGFLGLAQVRRGERSGGGLAWTGIGLNGFFALLAALSVLALVASSPEAEEERAAREPASASSPSPTPSASPSDPAPSRPAEDGAQPRPAPEEEERDREPAPAEEPAEPVTVETTRAPEPPPARETEPEPAAVYYENCAAARAAGAAPVHAGEPGYAPHLDRDGDGVGCDS
ncbi:excalibur calcium-binding domain-containing protein [Marinactinospora thermotolerans]|uniref:Excalibur calcium-binding domain-containing protein n=1 Tax=Marinactinospora thermotolerans DSM 45154 TaxID=1122192 RepID=A0A1T4PSB8_9ACTN|nr:excalibur calcium-binding domain-containing protein [Marinactinospora thermotolerans]SJZ94452.1 protein of unknown function [Marinactinospora thermotolerans DSM 45154]